MANLGGDQIHAFLAAVGNQCPDPAQLYLLGGSALFLLGSPRPTIDIDYVGDDLQKNNLQLIMEQIAQEMHLEVEAVPIDRFLPLPDGVTERRISVGQFGSVEVFIYDPYSIALSKIDRGFDTDLEDVVFLIRNGLVSIDRLEIMLHMTFDAASQFDLHPEESLFHLQAVRKLLGLE
jgi:hypothetical protein